MKKKGPVAPEISAAAAALGRLGGRARSKRKTATARQNGQLGGPPRQYPEGTTPVQRHHLRNIATHGRVTSPAQQRALDAVLRLTKEPR